MTSNPFIIGVAGGTGSGKSTVVRRISETLGPARVARVEQDAYYRGAGSLSLEERADRNYDHPDAIDSDLLVAQVTQLKAGHAIDAPTYDFVLHERRVETRRVEPRPCLVVEGILVLALEPLRQILDLRLYVETDADVRLIRRLRRDTRERGRDPEAVIEQWERTVQPMHLQFVDPSRRHAHLIIPEGGWNEVALEVILGHLHHVLGAPA